MIRLIVHTEVVHQILEDDGVALGEKVNKLAAGRKWQGGVLSSIVGANGMDECRHEERGKKKEGENYAWSAVESSAEIFEEREEHGT